MADKTWVPPTQFREQGTKNLRTVNHRLATSLPACALEPSALCTLKVSLHPQKALGAAAEGQPTVWVEGWESFDGPTCGAL